LREDAGHNGLRDCDKVLYHYTDEASFFLTILEDAKILARNESASPMGIKR
jgi:hypothetical protein